jgi:uncharacterized DUF497 family protein
MQFEWDAAKAAANVLKHGAEFDEASTVFADGLAATGRDPDHSTSEARFLTFGLSRNGRVHAVSHTDRGGVLLVISARPVTRNKKQTYEQD